MKVACIFGSDIPPIPDDIPVEEIQEFQFNSRPYKFADIDISEKATIGELIEKIHELFEKPSFVNVTVDEEIITLTCSYSNYSHHNEDDSKYIKDLGVKINELFKMGPNGELCLYISDSFGLAN